MTLNVQGQAVFQGQAQGQAQGQLLRLALLLKLATLELNNVLQKCSLNIKLHFVFEHPYSQTNI